MAGDCDQGDSEEVESESISGYVAVRVIPKRRCGIMGFLAYQIVVWIYTMVICGDPDEFQ